MKKRSPGSALPVRIQTGSLLCRVKKRESAGRIFWNASRYRSHFFLLLSNSDILFFPWIFIFSMRKLFILRRTAVVDPSAGTRQSQPMNTFLFFVYKIGHRN